MKSVKFGQNMVLSFELSLSNLDPLLCFSCGSSRCSDIMGVMLMSDFIFLQVDVELLCLFVNTDL